MKKVILPLMVVLILAAAAFSVVLLFKSREEKKELKIITEPYYSISGSKGKAYGQHLVVYDGDLKIIDLNSREVLKTIPIPNKKVLGFDIYEDKILWSDLRNEPSPDNVDENNETGNSDVFLYDMNTDSISQITTNRSAQTEPVICGNYIAWQDNRDDTATDGYPQWNIYLYDLEKKSETRITHAEGVHTNCRLYGKRLIWEDGRYARAALGSRFNYELPSNNTDIYMYDLEHNREKPVAYERCQECRPDIYENLIVWEDRNNMSHNADIKIYNADTLKVKNITDDDYSQIKPVINSDVVVWVDERRGTEKFTGIEKNKIGNSDIGIYDLQTGKQSLVEEEGVQTDCSVTPSYIVYTSKPDEETSLIKVLKYSRVLQPSK